jgi:transmembrane sensor
LEQEHEHIDDLLGKYLAGEASVSEQTIVSRWIEESEDNRKYFGQLKKIFEGAGAVSTWNDYNTDLAWNKVKANLRKGNGKVVPMVEPKRSLAQWWKMAAAILIFLSVGLYLYRSAQNPLPPVEVIARAHAFSDTLPDGTDVFLNKKTKLVYAFDEKKKLHDVKLQGEAYFNIKHKAKEDFIIKTGEVFIRDIGTSFNVKAYPESDVIEVLVEEGEIVFYTADNPGIHLKTSGKGVYNKKTKEFTIDQPDPNITAYKTKFFVFTATTLKEAVAALNDVYEVPIIIDQNLNNCPITVSFRNESIDEIATIIGETLNLTVTRDEKGIKLTGKGCE